MTLGRGRRASSSSSLAPGVGKPPRVLAINYEGWLAGCGTSHRQLDVVLWCKPKLNSVLRHEPQLNSVWLDELNCVLWQEQPLNSVLWYEQQYLNSVLPGEPRAIELRTVARAKIELRIEQRARIKFHTARRTTIKMHTARRTEGN